jgi:hypothetical protein
MLTPPAHSGRLCGYDVAIRNPTTGKLQTDGKIDNLRYEINADNTGRVYRVNDNGTETLITDEVIHFGGLTKKHVMQFTADAGVTINGRYLAPDGKADTVVIRWSEAEKPHIKTFFFSGTKTFDTIIASNPELTRLHTYDKEEAVKTPYPYLEIRNYEPFEPSVGATENIARCTDIDGDRQNDIYQLDFVHNGVFLPLGKDEVVGSDFGSKMKSDFARIGIEFTGNRCQ